MLPAGSRRPAGPERDLRHRDRDGVVDDEHVSHRIPPSLRSPGARTSVCRRPPSRCPSCGPAPAALGRRPGVEDLKAGRTRRARACACGRRPRRPRRERRPQALEPAVRRAGDVEHADPHAVELELQPVRDDAARTAAESTLPWTAWSGGPSERSNSSTGMSIRSPAWRIASASRQRSRHAGGIARSPRGR